MLNIISSNLDRVAFAVACEFLHLDKLCDQDYVFLTEFACVIKPIADAITHLESSVKTFGNYLPMLFGCRTALKDLADEKKLKFCEPLLTAVRNGFAKRFNHLMRLGDIYGRGDPKAVPLFLAMITNPEYKMNFIPNTWFYENANGIHHIKTILLNAMKQWVEEEEKANSNENQTDSNAAPESNSVGNATKGIVSNQTHAILSSFSLDTYSEFH